MFAQPPVQYVQPLSASHAVRSELSLLHASAATGVGLIASRRAGDINFQPDDTGDPAAGQRPSLSPPTGVRALNDGPCQFAYRWNVFFGRP